MSRFVRCVLGATLALTMAAGVAQAQTLRSQMTTAGITRPIYVVAPPGDNNRLFIIEQRLGSSNTSGRIRVFDRVNNLLSSTIYLSVTGLAGGSEQGLLGLAFHPNFMTNGYFYVYYTENPVTNVSRGSAVVARYRATGGNPLATTADPASATVLMRMLQPDANHNGGWMDFGPDGHLYIATGDGGCGNDSNCGGGTPSIDPPGHTAGMGNAQDITNNLLGKMLRIDVDGPDNIPGNADDDQFPADPARNYAIPAGNPFNGVNGDAEIWSYGLRNPWRNSFDRDTGDLWIADVGQDAREEVNFEPMGVGGRNYGWRCMEGNVCTGLSGCTCNSPSLTLPVHTYNHSGTSAVCSITGGYVYRGCAMPALRGTYFFADYCSGQIWSFRRAANGAITELTERTNELRTAIGGQILDNPTSFGEDNEGELYITDQTGGQLFKIVPAVAPPDCNANGRADGCDIAFGFSQDQNANGVPDECECPPCVADFNNSGGTPDDADVAEFFQAWNDGEFCADANGSGGTPDDADVAVFFALWNDGGC
ncbi:MAG: PQQ-dependent sugar dehydrogenase [Phycisphaerales bacterium]|nr:PQQ-dependent sugar dehydrogenase [Phycisphaerales bacterium]